MHKRLTLSAVTVLGLGFGVAAQADVTPGYYAGASLGQSTVEVDLGFTFDESDTAFKVFGGYTFNQYFSVELAWFDGGDPEMDISGAGSLSVGFDGFVGSAVGTLPVTEAFTLFGKVGSASYDAKVAASVVGGGSESEEISDQDLTYGVGAAFSFGNNFSLRAEYEMVDVDEIDVSLWSLGAVYRF